MIVQGRDLTVVYGARTVLHGVDVELAEGARCALTGRSGSGKTTLLLVLAGLLAPTRGELRLGVRPRDVLYVPQAPSLVPELTAVQNASLGLRVRGVVPEEAEERGRDQLRALGLTASDDALPAELSGGMQQRVALARALAVQPRLLLADEPTGALDQTTGRRVLDILLEHTRHTGATLVVATHDEDVAARLDSRLVVGTALVR